MEKLALFGGAPIRTTPYLWHITTGAEEKLAVMRVMDRGLLSEYEGTNNQYFMGGPEVQALEKEWAAHFKVKHALAVNSATSGLFAAAGACGFGPGDEVIVTPFTMSATPSAILAYNAIPVFADVDPITFNLDPDDVERKITPRTKAIYVVHIFGHPAPMDRIMAIAKKHGLKVVEDAAQSPMAKFGNIYTGGIGDLGVFSLNCNKHIQCGEGGIVTTNDDALAERVALIRNHAEAVVNSGRKYDSLVSMLGSNYRMNEIEAAISREQLKKLPTLLHERLALVDRLNREVKKVGGYFIPEVKAGATHVYYRYGLLLDPAVWQGVKAPQVVKALNAEGMDFYVSYMKPLYRQPLYRQQVLFGEQGCPFACPLYKGKVNYAEGICPVAENLENVLISTEIVRPKQTLGDMDEIAAALKKVLDNREQVKSIAV